MAIAFSRIAWFGPSSVGPRLAAFVAINIGLVGVIYGLLLQGLVELTAGAAIANVLLHTVTPVVVPIFWLLFVPKGQLGLRDPFVWSLYPLGYVAYALVAAHHRGGSPIHSSIISRTAFHK